MDHILTWKDCEVDKDQSYFLAETGATDVKIVIDFGCQTTMSAILLRNTRNGHHGDRATKDFSVEMSQNMQDW